MVRAFETRVHGSEYAVDEADAGRNKQEHGDQANGVAIDRSYGIIRMVHFFRAWLPLAGGRSITFRLLGSSGTKLGANASTSHPTARSTFANGARREPRRTWAYLAIPNRVWPGRF